MKRSAYLMSKVVIVAALAAGAVGVANADMGRFDSGYAYFNKYPFDKAPSERELQALSSDGPAWHTQAAPTPVASSGEIDVAQGADRETLAARLARIFSPAKQDAQAC